MSNESSLGAVIKTKEQADRFMESLNRLSDSMNKEATAKTEPIKKSNDEDTEDKGQG